MGAIYRPRLADSHQVNAKRKCHHPSRHPSGEIASSTKATATSPRPKYAPYVVQFRVTTNTPRNRQVLTAHPRGRCAGLFPGKNVAPNAARRELKILAACGPALKAKSKSAGSQRDPEPSLTHGSAAQFAGKKRERGLPAPSFTYAIQEAWFLCCPSPPFFRDASPAAPLN